ncbi:hypothetical protein ASD74_19565 [Rhizobium sp. Root564]|nr:hypothetical protein ASD74_19565 [Rhizobium sp. Root564]
MNKFCHHIAQAAEADGFRVGPGLAGSGFKPFVCRSRMAGREVCAKGAVAVETVPVLRMARDGFVPRLDLRPDVLGERQAAKRRTDMAFAALAASGIGAGQRRALTFKEDRRA